MIARQVVIAVAVVVKMKTKEIRKKGAENRVAGGGALI